ncbi:MAG: recombinase family protein [Oscillospiraceae bacterium]|nr:recombinase family protein [Oscillospiraceae bacterium]
MAIAKYAELLERPPQVSIPWKAALYIRLSREDGDKAESNSITSQREILKEYLKLHPDIEIYDFYVDDGWSGTNFDRPDFKRMMEDIYSGKVNCVIVKDLSRFGRNYTDTGHYLDNVFVRYQIRFIALNNGVDTATNNMNAATRCITVGVQNVINESLAATTSVNVRGTLNVNREQGKFIGSFATYGYMKDPADHHKLIIDPESAPVVELIFRKFIDGRSIIGIAKDLNEMGIPNPTRYKQLKGLNYQHPAGQKLDGMWPDSSVRRILRNEMYIGNMVQGKTTTISYKISKCRNIPQSDWIVVENTHEAIIDKDTFEKAQSLFNQFTRTSPKKRDIDLFSGFLRCADCHAAMGKKTNNHSYGTYHYYRCSTARKMNKSACSNHTIRADKLESAVMTTVQTMVDVAIAMDKLVKHINNSPVKKQESNHIHSAIATHEAELTKYRQMVLDLYPDWKNDLITKEEYLRLKEQLNEKISGLEHNLTILQKAQDEFTGEFPEDNKFFTHFTKYGLIEKLTRPLLVELVDKIYIHEGGNITIKFKFEDAYEQAMEFINLNYEAIMSA